MNYDGLDEEPLNKILERFTYKPSWTFTICEGRLFIRALAPDTDDHTKIIPINFQTSIPRFRTPDYPWDRWLLDQILNVERHEAEEFFKIDGVKVFDPHG